MIVQLVVEPMDRFTALDRTSVTIVIPCTEIVIEPPLSFTFDGLTEKLTCLRCHSEDEVEAALKRNIFFFMNEQNGGLLCFFYSVILSKGFSK